MKLSLEPFERFDLLPLSFSRINKLYYFDKAVEEKKLEDDPKRSTERTNIPLYIKGFWK